MTFEQILKNNGLMLDGSTTAPRKIGNTAAKRQIKEAMIKYERLYFQDLIYAHGSITSDIFSGIDTRDITADLSIANVNIDFKDMGKCPGSYERDTNTIFLNYFYFDYFTLLHEMIHAYSDTLRKYDYGYSLRNYATFKLYEHLRGKIKDIEGMITKWLRFDIQNGLIDQGRIGHDVLFYLKSIDIELQLNFTPCEVIGYEAPKYEVIRAA